MVNQFRGESGDHPIPISKGTKGTGILRNVRPSPFAYMYEAKQHNTKCALCEKYNNCVKQHNIVLRREGNINI